MVEPELGHEAYFSIYGQGSSLKRHLDEKHEDVKGAKGWTTTSRRSISWLLYLSDDEWTTEERGGALRVYPQTEVIGEALNCLKPGATTPGGSHDGNLQVGWLRTFIASSTDGTTEGSKVVKLPVYLDTSSVLYTLEPSLEPSMREISSTSAFWKRRDLTKEFDVHVRQRSALEAKIARGSTSMSTSTANNFDSSGSTAQKIFHRECFVAPEDFLREEESMNFVLIEDTDLWAAGGMPEGSAVVDIAPRGGRLVIFDSVILPHEVMLTKLGSRMALAGWFHEKQQDLTV